MPPRGSKILKAAPPPSQPPASDMSALVQRVNELSLKVLNKPLGKGALEGLPRFKRWVEGAGEFDVTGLRDRLATLTTFVNQIKSEDVDPMKAKVLDHELRIGRLEDAPAPRPFP